MLLRKCVKHLAGDYWDGFLDRQVAEFVFLKESVSVNAFDLLNQPLSFGNEFHGSDFFV